MQLGADLWCAQGASEFARAHEAWVLLECLVRHALGAAHQEAAGEGGQRAAYQMISPGAYLVTHLAPWRLQMGTLRPLMWLGEICTQ